jgi:hypothetical protein
MQVITLSLIYDQVTYETSIHASNQSTYGILQHMYEAHKFNQIGAGPRVESNEVCGIELDQHHSVLYAQKPPSLYCLQSASMTWLQLGLQIGYQLVKKFDLFAQHQSDVFALKTITLAVASILGPCS